MNDRLIRAQITHSPSLNQCSRDAYLVWPWLCMMADACGRFNASPRVVRVNIFPLRDDVSDSEVATWLHEYEHAGQITRWEADGHEYGEITNFRKHQKLRYGKRSAIPKPGEAEEQSAVAERRLPPEVREALENAYPGRVTERHLQTCVRWLFGPARHSAAEIVEALTLAATKDEPLSYAGKVLQGEKRGPARKTSAEKKPVDYWPTWEESLTT